MLLTLTPLACTAQPWGPRRSMMMMLSFSHAHAHTHTPHPVCPPLPLFTDLKPQNHSDNIFIIVVQLCLHHPHPPMPPWGICPPTLIVIYPPTLLPPSGCVPIQAHTTTLPTPSPSFPHPHHHCPHSTVTWPVGALSDLVILKFSFFILLMTSLY